MRIAFLLSFFVLLPLLHFITGKLLEQGAAWAVNRAQSVAVSLNPGQLVVDIVQRPIALTHLSAMPVGARGWSMHSDGVVAREAKTYFASFYKVSSGLSSHRVAAYQKKLVADFSRVQNLFPVASVSFK